MSQPACPACAGAIFPDDVFCVHCGTRVSAVVAVPLEGPTRADVVASTGIHPTGRPCPGCAGATSSEDRFCQLCGYSLQEPEAVGPDVPSATSPPSADASAVCPACGDSVFSDETFCVSCGARVATAAPAVAGAGGRGGTRVMEALRAGRTALTPPCPHCGVGTVPGDPFCTSCGTRLSDGPPPPAVVADRPGGGPREAEIVLGRKDAADDAWDEVRRKLEAATLGEYDIARELGRGGMAAVYLAHDVALNRKVAIKVMAPGLLLGRGMVERFSREAQTVANLSHPNIIQIYTVRHVDDLHFFVMKYVEGNSLQLVLEQQGALPLPIVRQVMYQVGSGLGYAHRRGIVHRDIKPANILIDTEGNAVVMDFGIAKVAEEGGGAGQSGMTQAGTVVGTPAYMSPEQCYSAEVTWAADQYSLGIVGYEMMTGATPFGGSPFEVMQAHTQDDPPPIRPQRRDCPSAVEAAILRMLEKKATDRHPSMAEALEAVGALPASPDAPVHQEMAALAQLEVAGNRDGRPLTPRSPAPGIRRAVRRRRNRTPLLVAGAVAAAAAALAAVAYWTSLRSSPAIAVDSTAPGVAAVASLALSARSDSVLVGATVVLRAVVADSAGQPLADRPVGWTTSDSSIAAVAGRGAEATISGLEPGRVTITAASGARIETAEIVVIAPRRSALTVSAPKRELVLGEKANLAAILTDSLGNRDARAVIRWTSATPSVAEVDGAGVVTARRPGRVRITAASGAQSGSVDLTIRGPQASAITVFAPGGALVPGRTARVRAEVSWEGGTAGSTAGMVWRATPASVATIAGSDSTGANLTLLQEGEVAITAELAGVRGSTGLVVRAAPAVAVDLSRTAVSFESPPDGSPPEQTVTVAVRGIDEQPVVGPVEYGIGTGWLTTQLQGALITIRANPKALAPGSYRAGVPVAAGSTIRTIDVTLVVIAPAAAAAADLEATRDALQAILDRYAKALVARDSAAIRDLYPGISERGMSDVLRSKLADQYEIQLRRTTPLRAGSQDGTIEADVSAGVFTGGGSNIQTLIYRFSRAGSGWKIAAVRASR